MSDSHPSSEAEVAARAKAIESLLVEKGLVGTDAIDRVAGAYESDIGPMLGARIVARLE